MWPVAECVSTLLLMFCVSVCRREAAMESGLLTAVQVPLCVARVANSLWPTLKELSAVGNINCKSDLQVLSGVLIFIV